ncbi:hypothetical protein D9M71_453350 [compost metagenome]
MIPASAIFDAYAEHAPARLQSPRFKPVAHRPRYVIVEASREDEAALRESWETGEPVEIAGVRFEMAVIARRRGWFSPALVRGVEMR